MKTISKYPNYKITRDGKIWSIRSRRWLKLQKCPSSGGYYRIQLGHKQPKEWIHRLVLESYTGKCPEGMECRHLDSNPINNNLNNLAWGTKSENMIDNVYRQSSKNQKLSCQDVRMIIYTCRTGLFSKTSVAKMYNVSCSTINDILYKRSWKHIWSKR